jgi:hypothetical protein
MYPKYLGQEIDEMWCDSDNRHHTWWRFEMPLAGAEAEAEEEAEAERQCSMLTCYWSGLITYLQCPFCIRASNTLNNWIRCYDNPCFQLRLSILPFAIAAPQKHRCRCRCRNSELRRRRVHHHMISSTQTFLSLRCCTYLVLGFSYVNQRWFGTAPSRVVRDC